MKITTSMADNAVILIEVEGDVDAFTAGELDRTFNDLLAQGHSRLVVDASHMGFISSAGLRSITFAQREAADRGGQVRICGLSAQARRAFELTGLDECLHLSSLCGEAMEGW